MLSTRKAQRLSVGGFYWGWSCRHPLPSINQNSRSLETMHVFSVNHNVCKKHFRHSESLLSGMVGTQVVSENPRCQSRAMQQSHLPNEKKSSQRKEEHLSKKRGKRLASPILQNEMKDRSPVPQRPSQKRVKQRIARFSF